MRSMLACPNLLFHNQLWSCMLEKHLSWSSYFEIFSLVCPVKMVLSFLISLIMQWDASKITLKPLSQSWLMLKRLCFKPSTKKTLSIREDVSLPMLPWPMILPFALSPKVTYPFFLFIRKANLIHLRSCVLSIYYPRTTYPSLKPTI